MIGFAGHRRLTLRPPPPLLEDATGHRPPAATPGRAASCCRPRRRPGSRTWQWPLRTGGPCSTGSGRPLLRSSHAAQPGDRPRKGHRRPPRRRPWWPRPGSGRRSSGPSYIHLVGPGRGRELTRLGHPGDPIGHSHHRSIWIGHHDVSGASFWEEVPGRGPDRAGRARTRVKEGAEVKAVSRASGGVRRMQAGALREAALVFRRRPRGPRPRDRHRAPAGIEGRQGHVRRHSLRPPRDPGRPHDGGRGGARRRASSTPTRPRTRRAATGSTRTGATTRGRCPSRGRVKEAARTDCPAIPAGIACFNHPGNSPADTIWHVRGTTAGWARASRRDAPR